MAKLLYAGGAHTVGGANACPYGYSLDDLTESIRGEPAPYESNRILSMAASGGFLYTSGYANRITKYSLSDLTIALQGQEYGGATLRQMIISGDYLYIAALTGSFLNQGYIYKVRLSDLVKVAESESGSDGYRGIATDGTYIYAGDSSRQVRKILMQDMSTVWLKSVGGTGTINGLVCHDGNIIMAGGYDEKKLYKYDADSLTKIAESISFGYAVGSLNVDGDNAYTRTDNYSQPLQNKLIKCAVSNLSKITDLVVPRVSILLAQDGRLFSTNSSTFKISEHDTSSLATIAEGPAYTGYINSLVIASAAVIKEEFVPNYPPSSYIRLQFRAGDSEALPMGTYYVDRTDFKVGDTEVKVDARNSIGKYLRDQTFDERYNYPEALLSSQLNKLLSTAGITNFYIGDSSDLVGLEFSPDGDYLSGIDEFLKFVPGWQIREEADGKVVIGNPSDSQFTQPSRYTFYRDKDVFSRAQVKDDVSVYGRVCVHANDFGIKVYRAVTSTLGWLPPAQKTLYVEAPDGTTTSQAAAMADSLATSMANSGEVETFVGPIRPQLIPGDEAAIMDSAGPTLLGTITTVRHSFGRRGFYTEFTVDSGGRINRPLLRDYIQQLTVRPKTVKKI